MGTTAPDARPPLLFFKRRRAMATSGLGSRSFCDQRSGAKRMARYTPKAFLPRPAYGLGSAPSSTKGFPPAWSATGIGTSSSVITLRWFARTRANHQQGGRTGGTYNERNRRWFE